MTVEDIKAELVTLAAKAKISGKNAEERKDVVYAAYMSGAAFTLKSVLDMLCEVDPEVRVEPETKVKVIVKVKTIPRKEREVPKGAGKHTKEFRKICKVCGKEFIAHSSKAELCSQKCRNAAQRQSHKKSDTKRKQETLARKKRGDSLQEDAALARQNNISYGELQARRYIAEMAAKRKEARA